MTRQTQSRILSRRDALIFSIAAGSTAWLGCSASAATQAAPATPPVAPSLPPSPAQAPSAATSAASTAAQAPPPSFTWRPDEQALLAAPAEGFDIVVRSSPRAAVLRSWARPVPAGLDLTVVERRMEQTMRAAKGVGLAAPQVGLRLRGATLELDYKTDHPRTVFVRNPLIVERSDETIEGYEMCLSVPGVGGLVRRNRWIRIQHDSVEGEHLITEAEGHNAILWQHELDHLDGVLYVDKVQGQLLPSDEVRRLRKQPEQEKSSALAPSAAPWLRADHAEGSFMLLPRG